MGGLQTKYAELFSLSIEQPFYQNKICRSYQTTPVLDYTLVPSGECRQVMNRMDLVFRNTDTTGGIIVLGRVLGTNGGGDDLLRFPATASDKLSFWIVLNNPNLVNFDDLPATLPTSQFYYFSNQLADIAAPRTGLHLSIDPTGVKGANDTIKRSDVTYRYHHPVPIAPNTAKIKHLLTGVSIDPYTVMNQNGQADLIFDLHTLPQGKCQLNINGVPTDTFYFTGQLPPLPVFGLIELSLASTLAANYRIIEADRSLTAQRPDYTIQFNNRSTTWRYTVHLLPTSPLYLEMAALSAADKTTYLNELNIVTNDTSITFDKDSVADFDIVFKSHTPIAFLERYVSSSSATHDSLSLTLKKYIGDPKEDFVKTSLPFPSGATIDATQPPAIYSDVFLTL